MAPRANWKGHLKLSLVSCPVALYPATSEREKVRFHRINRRTGNRLKQQNIDAVTGEVVPPEQIGRGYEFGGHMIEVSDAEIEAIDIDSNRTIAIESFVPRAEIDSLYNVRPYYIAPDGESGLEAFAVIRQAMETMQVVGIARLVLSTREHIVAIEPRGKGLLGTLLRYPYEIRDEQEIFGDISDVKIDREMLDLAMEIIRRKAGRFRPETFTDRFQDALKALLKQKEGGQEIRPRPAQPSAKIINIMDALRRSVEAEGGSVKRPPRRASPPLQPKGKAEARSQRRALSRKRATAR